MNKIFIKSNIEIKKAANILLKTGERCLVVINNEKKLLGTLSSGDIRKNIIKGLNIKNSIKNIYNKKPIVLLENEATKEKIKKIFLNKNCDLIPIISKDKKIKKIVFFNKFFKKKRVKNTKVLNSKVVLMAGGFGTRLGPVAKILPKPLIPINGKPVIEHIINNFSVQGVKDFTISIHYKGKLLKAYFDELNPSYSIKYIEEKKPLGSVGCLSLIKKKLRDDFFLINCDTIIKTDLKKILEFHKKNRFDLTITVVRKNFSVPYGVCESNLNFELNKLQEKPKFNFLVNTGLYVISPHILKDLPNNKFFEMNTFIDKLKKKGKKVGIFTIANNSWIDVGQWDKYQFAEKKMKLRKIKK